MPSILSPFKAIRYLFKKPKTLRYPFEKKEPAQRYRGFHLNDWDKCTGCGNCADICPNEAINMIKIKEIKPKEGEKNERPQLDYGRCCFCGLCVEICPAGSLRLSRDYFHIHFDTKTFTFLPEDEKTDKEHFLPEDKYSILKASLTHRKKNNEGFKSDPEHILYEPDRVPMSEVPPDKRKVSFIEQVIGYNDEEARKEASRCLECKLCEDACPAHLKISDYINAIYENKSAEALKIIFEDNPIPAICGRICMKHCESACSLSIKGEPLAIRWLKRFASDSIKDYKTALELSPGKPTGKKIAIIGAGPSGLSAAYFLRLKGHKITVYDAQNAGGGLIRIGPPEYRLPIESIDKDVNYIKSLGVIFKFNTKVGKDISFNLIYKNSDAVFMAIGTQVSRSTRVKNADKALLALPFLKENKIGKRVKVGRKTIVIGGGNVAMDVARESIRLQYIQYKDKKIETMTVSLEDWDEMPATPEEIEETKEEGIKFNPGWGPKEIKVKNNKIIGLLCMKVKSVFDEKGRFRPTFYEDKEKFFKGDMVIEAIGQGTDFSFLPKHLMKKLKFTSRKKIEVDRNGQTSIPKLFAGGDIVNINLDAVTAIADAKQSAKGINKILKT